MPGPVQIPVDTYIRAWSERDSAVRATMLEACFAEDGRMVTRSREIRGRAGLAEEMARFLADPRLLRIRVRWKSGSHEKDQYADRHGSPG